MRPGVNGPGVYPARSRNPRRGLPPPALTPRPSPPRSPTSCELGSLLSPSLLPSYREGPRPLTWTEAQPPGRAPLHHPGGLPSSADAAAGLSVYNTTYKTLRGASPRGAGPPPSGAAAPSAVPGTHPASAGQRPASLRAQGTGHTGGRPLSPSPLDQWPLRGSHEATGPLPAAFPLCCLYWGPGSLKPVVPVGPPTTWGQTLSLPLSPSYRSTPTHRAQYLANSTFSKILDE